MLNICLFFHSLPVLKGILKFRLPPFIKFNKDLQTPPPFIKHLRVKGFLNTKFCDEVWVWSEN